jgi:3-deoxy-D-manno-octulosonic-acid transferase
MTMFWSIFYNALIVPLEWIAFHLVAVFDRKAKRGIAGRQHLFEQLEQDIAKLSPTSKRIWFHSSSLGEFEQAKPIIAELKRTHAEIDIIVTFFSPSGYEHSQTYKHASVISYIPFDSQQNAERFVQIVKPTVAVIVRYDIWPNHIWALRRHNVPIFIASATLRPTTARKFPLLRQFHHALYNTLDYILTVSDDDKTVFASFHLHHPTLEVIGDTRYDQVEQRSRESKNRRVLPDAVTRGKKILVVGSSWLEDEEHLLPACCKLFEHDSAIVVILVPHEPTLEHLERLEQQLNGNASHLRFSELSGYRDEKIIIVDSVGILMALYQYAHVAYVGGSFTGGIHNVLEPAAYGIPVVFGPKHQNSQEAIQLVTESAAFVGRNSETLFQQFRMLFEDDRKRKRAGEFALGIVQRNGGATARFLSYLEKVL